jgi:hypothetical protein
VPFGVGLEAGVLIDVGVEAGMASEDEAGVVRWLINPMTGIEAKASRNRFLFM